MKKELEDLVRIKENDLNRHKEKRDLLRNKIRFCDQHKFNEEVRIAQIELSAVDELIYDFQDTIAGLKGILKTH